MRIMLFPKLVATEESTHTILKNCSVVIDGQNYLHNVYEDSKIPFLFGTEANEYAKHLRILLKMYKDANVKCYIVLKGGDSDIEQKIQKFQHSYVNFDTNEQFIAPVFIKDVYRQVLEELDIDYSICLMESKDECVALALELGCPVISFDIEFCFKKAPYIPYTTMKFDSARRSIQCRQFKLQDFLRRHSLSEEEAAIFATISDIKLFPEHCFDSLFQTWGVLNKNLYLQLKNLMLWLSRNNEQKARRGINRVLKTEADKKKFWDNCDYLLKNMRSSQPGYVTNYLIDSKLKIARQDRQWFEKGVALKTISRVYINLYKWRVIEGSWVTEDKTSPDSLLVAIDIVKYAYNLLTNFKEHTFKLYQEASNFIEISSKDSSIKRPRYDCVQSVFENGWEYIKRLKLFEHFLSESNINTEVLNKLPDEATVLLTALAYFARKKEIGNGNVTREVYAVLLSFVMINLSDEEGSHYLKKNNIEEGDSTKARSLTADYFKYNRVEARQKYEGAQIKKFVEFEYCLQHMNNLNDLCGSPYKPTRYHMVYSGTFVYKMFYEMRNKNPDDFINEMFQSAPSVLKHVKDLVAAVRQLHSSSTGDHSASHMLAGLSTLSHD